MNDLELAKALVGRLTQEQLSELKEFIAVRDNGLFPLPLTSLAPPPIPDMQTRQTRSEGLQIEFCESNAGSFSQALRAAQSSPLYSTRIENKKTWHVATWPQVDLEKALNLISTLSSLRNKRVYLDGTEQDWSEIFGFASCAIQRAKAYRPEHYCFGLDQHNLNPWGCIQTHLDWTEWARWFKYGKFEKQGFLAGGRLQWLFDKPRIRHELETSIYKLRFCPHMNTALIQASLQALPDRIDIERSTEWTFSESYEAFPGRPKITRKENIGDFTSTVEFYADGVRPLGTRAFQDVVRRAFTQVGLPANLLNNMSA